MTEEAINLGQTTFDIWHQLALCGKQRTPIWPFKYKINILSVMIMTDCAISMLNGRHRGWGYDSRRLDYRECGHRPG